MKNLQSIIHQFPPPCKPEVGNMQSFCTPHPEKGSLWGLPALI
jgi:hypothetical protein